jgi:aldose 1-epimerase
MAPTPLPDSIEISSGPLSARFLARNGGRMTHLTHARLGDILVPIPDAPFDPLNWPKGGAYPLFPFHNRIAGATFTHEGRTINLRPHPALGGDAIHGPAHRRAWHVVSHSDDRAELTLDYVADADWPFDFHASQTFRLDQNRLDITLRLTNTGNVSMPGGMGWHPYFAASLDKPVTCDARSTWPLNDKHLPTGAPQEARTSQELPAQSGYTLHFSQWTEVAAMLDGGACVTLSAGHGLSHLAAHRMPSYVCLEPVSHVAGALSLRLADREMAGIAILQPGVTFSASLSLTVYSSSIFKPK